MNTSSGDIIFIMSLLYTKWHGGQKDLGRKKSTTIFMRTVCGSRSSGTTQMCSQWEKSSVENEFLLIKGRKGKGVAFPHRVLPQAETTGAADSSSTYPSQHSVTIIGLNGYLTDSTEAKHTY